MSLVSEMQQILVELSVHRLVEVISVVAAKSAASHTWKKNEAEAALFVSRVEHAHINRKSRYSSQEQAESWCKSLPHQFPSHLSKFLV